MKFWLTPPKHERITKRLCFCPVYFCTNFLLSTSYKWISCTGYKPTNAVLCDETLTRRYLLSWESASEVKAWCSWIYLCVHTANNESGEKKDRDKERERERERKGVVCVVWRDTNKVMMWWWRKKTLRFVSSCTIVEEVEISNFLFLTDDNHPFCIMCDAEIIHSCTIPHSQFSAIHILTQTPMHQNSIIQMCYRTWTVCRIQRNTHPKENFGVESCSDETFSVREPRATRYDICVFFDHVFALSSLRQQRDE